MQNKFRYFYSVVWGSKDKLLGSQIVSRTSSLTLPHFPYKETLLLNTNQYGAVAKN